MPYEGEPTEFRPHPTGQHEGIVYMWRDRGSVPTQYGPKHKAVIGIESLTAMDPENDGKPFGIYDFVNISFGRGSNMRQRREQILGRQLTTKEERYFDPQEILEIRVGYVVVHRTVENTLYANIDALWRLEDQGKGALVNEVVKVEEHHDGTAGEQPVGKTEPEPPGPDHPDSLRRYCVDLLEALIDNRLITTQAGAPRIAAVPEQPENLLWKLVESAEAKLKKAGLALPASNPRGNDMETDLDDLPF